MDSEKVMYLKVVYRRDLLYPVCAVHSGSCWLLRIWLRQRRPPAIGLSHRHSWAILRTWRPPVNTEWMDGWMDGWMEENKPYLFFFDLLQCAKMGPSVVLGCPTPQVCVSQCPKENYVYLESEALERTGDRTTARQQLICKDGVNPVTSQESIEDLVKSEKCAAYYVTSKSVINRCIPAVFNEILNMQEEMKTKDNFPMQTMFGDKITGSKLENGTQYLAHFYKLKGYAELVFMDLCDSWPHILVGMLVAMVVLLLWIVLLRWLVMMIMAMTTMMITTTIMIQGPAGSHGGVVVVVGDDDDDNNDDNDDNNDPGVCWGLLVAMVVSLLWIVLLRWLVSFMVWLTLILFAGLFIFSSYYSYSRYYELKSKNITGEFGLSQAFVLNFEYYLTLKQTWLAFGCTSATLLLLFILIVLILAKRICIAIELIKEGSKAIGKMMLVLFWPVFPFILQIGVVAYWVTSALYIGSMGPKEYYRGNYTNIRAVVSSGDVNALLRRVPCEPDNTTLGELCEFVKYGGTRYATGMQIYMLFMFFWLMNFVVALGQMTLAGAFASYYWAFNKERDMPAMPVLSALGRCFRYHLGSLAFGSLLIALVQMVRAFLEYLDRKLKSSENDVAKFILKCLKCCFWCLEKLLKFINKNAYIMIAIYGRSFCAATKDAFLLIMRNVLRTFVLDKVSDFIMFVSKLMVTGAVAVASYYWFERSIPVLEDFVPDLHFRLVPVIILVLGSYLVSSCFFNVYDMAVDTLFLCFLEDLERNDGSPDKPYYMSKGLQKLLRKGVSQDEVDGFVLVEDLQEDPSLLTKDEGTTFNNPAADHAPAPATDHLTEHPVFTEAELTEEGLLAHPSSPHPHHPQQQPPTTLLPPPPPPKPKEKSPPVMDKNSKKSSHYGDGPKEMPPPPPPPPPPSSEEEEDKVVGEVSPQVLITVDEVDEGNKPDEDEG
ncbi:hypothetical protein ACOMHN_012580 [Nucella lapillus]